MPDITSDGKQNVGKSIFIRHFHGKIVIFGKNFALNVFRDNFFGKNDQNSVKMASQNKAQC